MAALRMMLQAPCPAPLRLRVLWHQALRHPQVGCASFRTLPAGCDVFVLVTSWWLRGFLVLASLRVLRWVASWCCGTSCPAHRCLAASASLAGLVRSPIRMLLPAHVWRPSFLGGLCSLAAGRSRCLGCASASVTTCTSNTEEEIAPLLSALRRLPLRASALRRLLPCRADAA